MKIVCDACAAKYSIADEKVRGKVFKIRCKKCSNIIVVRGAVSETADPVPPKYDQKETKVLPYQSYGSQQRSESGAEVTESAVWHLVIDQEQVGPLTVEEVLDRFQRGQIDSDGYVWREGFGDWERLADVDVFAGVAGGARGNDGGLGALFGSSGADPSDQYDEVRGGPNDPADLFAARGDDGAAADLFTGPSMVAASADSANDSDGLFAGVSSEAGVGGMGMEGVARSGGSPSGRSVGSTLTGQRNENSVLFSLNNLAALASDAPRPAPLSAQASISPPPLAASSASASGTPPPSEGSGLIDIRSMAQVYLGESKASTKPVGTADDLPVFSQTSFEAASPVLLPSVQPAVNNRLLIALVGLIGVLVIAAGVLAVIVLKADNERPQVASSDTDQPAAGDRTASDVPPTGAATAPAGEPAAAAGSSTGAPAGDGKTDQTGGTDSTGSAPPPSGDSAAAAGAAGASDEASEEKEPSRASDRDRKDRDRDKDKDRRDRDRDRRNGRSADSGSSRDKEPERAAAPPPPDPTATSGCDEVTCLVEPDKACCKKYARRSGSRSSDSDAVDPSLPDRPSRDDVASGIGDVKGSVSSCGSRAASGGVKVTVKIKISPNGSVSSATAGGGSPSLNSCVENAVKRARFPRTQSGTSVSYPFIF